MTNKGSVVSRQKLINMAAEQVAPLKDSRAGAKAGITRRVNHIDNLISEKHDGAVIQQKATELEKALQDFEEKCAAYALHAPEEDSAVYMMSSKDAVTQCLQRVGLYLNPRNENAQENSSRAGSVRSNA